MNGQDATSRIDGVLLPFLHARDEQESQQQLEQLLTISAEPLLRIIAKRKLETSVGSANSHTQGVEDVCGDALVQLIARLRDLKADPDGKAIRNFRGYVATIAYNACNEHMRQKYPRRYSLRNRLRYLMSHNPRFALWEKDGELNCGFVRWENKNPRDGLRRLRELLDSAQVFERSPLASRDLQRLNLTELVSLVFDTVENPVELDELVNALAHWAGIKHEMAGSNVDEDDDLPGRLADTHASVDVELERRIYVQRLWSEICELPQRQRAALLLNLKDVKGDDCIALFPLSGVTTPMDIAQLLDIPVERFAEMWNDLPLEDAAIAAHLGITRQQVINLRKSARERLARRMRAFEAGSVQN
jgi:RNA polymerase sigma factor (sigma-70 family)